MMRRMSRSARDATGHTSIRVTRETRDWLVYLLNRRQLAARSREHERGGRQYGAKAQFTIDDVVYDLAADRVDQDGADRYSYAGSVR